MKQVYGLSALVMLAASPSLAQGIEAEVTCEATGVTLEYRCVHSLAERGEALADARFTVKPDMPSMPMAHNIAPVEAKALEEAGRYESIFTLDMPGRWSMRLDLTAPRRDVVIVHWDFEPDEGESVTGHGHGAHDGAHDHD